MPFAVPCGEVRLQGRGRAQVGNEFTTEDRLALLVDSRGRLALVQRVAIGIFLVGLREVTIAPPRGFATALAHSGREKGKGNEKGARRRDSNFRTTDLQ